MSEKHLAERLMYPLPDGWRDDPEQVAALKEIWPKIITKNKELIDAEIASLRAQLDEARAKLKRKKEASAQIEKTATEAWRLIAALPYSSAAGELEEKLRALLSESKT